MKEIDYIWLKGVKYSSTRGNKIIISIKVSIFMAMSIVFLRNKDAGTYKTKLRIMYVKFDKFIPIRPSTPAIKTCRNQVRLTLYTVKAAELMTYK